MTLQGSECVHSELLTPLVAKMVEEPFKLLIMDSITANLRVDFSGRGELAERCASAGLADLTQHLTLDLYIQQRAAILRSTRCRQQKLGQLMNRLKKVRPGHYPVILAACVSEIEPAVDSC
jgi:Rad51